jgi:hypothetical protein
MSIKVYTTKTSVNRSLLGCVRGPLRLGVRVTALRVRLAPAAAAKPGPATEAALQGHCHWQVRVPAHGAGRPAGAAESGRCHFQGTSLRGTRAPSPRWVKIFASIELAAPGPGSGFKLRPSGRCRDSEAGEQGPAPSCLVEGRSAAHPGAGGSERAAAACLSRRQRRRV